MPESTWVVVANSAVARVFRLVHFPKIEEIAYLEHPESRLLNKELVSSKPGRTHNRVGFGRSAYEPKADHQLLEVEIFAKALSNFLQQGYEKKEFGRLYLFANAEFLGFLRQNLPVRVRESLVCEVSRDFTEYAKQDIEELLKKQ